MPAARGRAGSTAVMDIASVGANDASYVTGALWSVDGGLTAV